MGAFFEVGPGSAIGLGVFGPRLLPGKFEPYRQLENAVLASAHLAALLDDAAEILGRPRARPVLLAIRTVDPGVLQTTCRVGMGQTTALEAAIWPSVRRDGRWHGL